MKEAIQNAILRNFRSMLDTRVEPLNPLLVLHIRRESIVRDAIDQVKKDFSKNVLQFIWKEFQLDKHREEDFKKPLQVYFINEEGLDAGGIRKEFFLLLTKGILNPQYGMFSKYSFDDDYPQSFVVILSGLRRN